MTGSAATLAGRRARAWAAMAPVLAATPALARYAGWPIDQIPVIDPPDLRADYGRWNSIGASHAELSVAADDAERGGNGAVRPGIIAGWSTGSGGGVRGLFVADARERATYIGQALARLLPVKALPGARIALVLRANSALYSDVGRSRFRHFGLELDDRALGAALADFAPTVLIAPPHKWAALARIGARLPTLRHGFYGAESMGAGEQDWLASAMGGRPLPIYQATEGFIAGACRHGRLHLNDHALAIDLEPVPGSGHDRLIVTDLYRHSQPIVRVRLDDLVRPTGERCPCGFAGRVIAPVMGRVSDLWRWHFRVITPDRVWSAMEALVGPSAEWVAMASPHLVRVHVDARVEPGWAEQLQDALGIPVPLAMAQARLPIDAPKRRRVRWQE